MRDWSAADQVQAKLRKVVAVRTLVSSRLSIVVAVVVAAVTVGVGNANAATAFSGQARPLSVSAIGTSISIGDTGALPSTGGSQSAALLDLNVLGFASVGLLKGTTSGSGDEATSTATLVSVSVSLIGLSADVVKSTSTATCSGTTPSVSGSSELVNVTLLGLPISAPMPNLAISAPGGISVILNEQVSSVSGNQGSMTVNAIHVTGPGIDIVVAGAESDITC
jgi:hypothetical protein